MRTDVSMFLSCVAPLIALSAPAGEWPQFRGPTGDGIAVGAEPPLTWSEDTHIAWKVAVPGLGRSSPVVSRDCVWLTTACTRPDPNAAGATLLSLKALCLERDSGRLRYETTVFDNLKPEPIHDLNSHATPTPVLAVDQLYCDFGNYGTACLQADTGRVRWQTRLPVEHQLGPGSSPVVCGDRLVLVRDGCDVQYVAALDTRTGERLWKTDRPPIEAEGPAYKKSFSTPLVIEGPDGPQIISVGPHWVIAYEPAAGKEIWRLRHGEGYSIGPRPVYGKGLIYITTGGYVAQLCAIRVDGRGDVTATHVAWKATENVPLMASPLLAGDVLYMVSDGGVLSCLDARSGALRRRERLPGNYAASPVYAGGRIYFVSRDGRATVLAADDTLARLAENRIKGTVIASPAFVGRAIFLRTDTHLYRLEERGEK